MDREKLDTTVKAYDALIGETLETGYDKEKAFEYFTMSIMWLERGVEIKRLKDMEELEKL